MSNLITFRSTTTAGCKTIFYSEFWRMKEKNE